MLKIRLSRVGKSHSPIYRLVVAEKSRAVKRENLEILGLYNPTNKEDKFQVKKDRVLYWVGLGAQPSDTARNLLCDFDVLPKKDKIKTVHGKATKKKAGKETGEKKPESAEVVEEVSGGTPEALTDEVAPTDEALTEKSEATEEVSALDQKAEEVSVETESTETPKEEVTSAEEPLPKEEKSE